MSARPWFSLLGSNWRRMGLVTFVALLVFVVLAAGHLVRRRDELTALRAIAVAGVIASTYGILQYFDIDPLQSASLYHAMAGDSVIVRPPGTLGHADYFGWWLAVSLFCGVALRGRERLGWIAAGFSAVAIVATGTRSAMLGVLAGAVCFIVLSGFRPRRIHGIAAALVLTVAGGFYVSPAGDRLRARVTWSADEPLGGARPLQWRDSVRMAAERPLTGYGLETFSSEFPAFQSEGLARQFPDFYHESPHNSALDLLSEGGFPGLLLGIGWLALAGLAVRNALPVDSRLAASLGAALVASTVAGMFGALTLGPVFLTAAVLAMLVGIGPAGGSRKVVVSERALVFCGAPLAACLIVYGVWLGVADFEAARFQRSPSADAYQSLAGVAMPGAGEDLYFARRLSQICGNRLDCVQLSLAAAARATESSDNPPNAWYNLSIFAAARNDARGVESSLRKASALAPNWFKPHWTLGRFLKLTGQVEEAAKETARAVFLDNGKDAEVGQ